MLPGRSTYQTLTSAAAVDHFCPLHAPFCCRLPLRLLECPPANTFLLQNKEVVPHISKLVQVCSRSQSMAANNVACVVNTLSVSMLSSQRWHVMSQVCMCIILRCVSA